MNFTSEIEAYCAIHGMPDRVDCIFVDMNCIMRGKQLPGNSIEKLSTVGMRLPISTHVLNIFGMDVHNTGLALTRGDPDGIGWPVAGSLCRVPWLDGNVAQVLMRLEEIDGSRCIYDPREQLVAMSERFGALGMTPVVATEIEFYLYRQPKNAGDAPMPPIGLGRSQLYEFDAAENCEAVLEDINSACKVQGIPTDVLIAEFGPGQFEINFKHDADVVKAADHAALFRRLVRSVARKHGLEATFMAKPYGGGTAGSGMHVHVSLEDDQGENIFAPESLTGGPLPHAIGGLLATMGDLQAIFAPHANSYRRFQPETYAPLKADWGVDHRGAAVRVPEFAGPGTRLEHRICGADANPYLALTAILGGMLWGIENQCDPGKPLEEEGDIIHSQLHREWSNALDAFSRSELAEFCFGAEYRRVFTASKQSEIDQLGAQVSNLEYQTYLGRI